MERQRYCSILPDDDIDNLIYEEDDDYQDHYSQSEPQEESNENDDLYEVENEDIEAGACTEEFMNDGKGYIQFTPTEWQHILNVWRTQDHSHPEWEKINQDIYNAMYPFCKYVAFKYYRTYLPLYGEDLIQEGYYGMLQALKTYDPYRAAPTTWCFREIIHADRDLISRMAHNTSAHFQAIVRKIGKFIEKREREGIPWSVDDLSIELGESPTTIETALQVYKINKQQISADTPVMEGSNTKLVDRLVSEIPGPLATLIDKERYENLLTAIQKYLTVQERVAMLCNYGFFNGDPMSAPEIAKASKKMGPKYAIQQQDVRRLLNSGRLKLQRGLTKDGSLDSDISERSLKRKSAQKMDFLRNNNDLAKEFEQFDFSGL